MTAPPPPLVFAPVAVPRPWGGRRCRDQGLLDLPAATDGAEPIGEWWLLSAREDQPSRVCQGPDRGRSLAELLQRDPRSILGPDAGPRQRFPLLLKILDTAQHLSVQVHPSDQHLAGQGKTESWYVLNAEDDARLFLGLADHASLPQLFAEAQAGNPAAAQLLGSHPATPGTVAHLPAGLVHALGAGVLALEVQQSSDTTYRIYDWDRQPRRELHLDQAREVCSADQSAHLSSPVEVQSRPFRRELLVDCEHYALERLVIEGEAPLATGRLLHALCPLDGAIEIHNESGRVEVPRGHAALLAGGSGGYRVIGKGPGKGSATPAAPGPVEVLRAIPRHL